MKQGDILINKQGDKRKILGVCGEVYFLSHPDDFELITISSFAWTEKEIEEIGYTLLEEPWEPKEGEIYWFIDSGVEIGTFYWVNSAPDNFRKYMKNIFKTKELAEQALQEIKKKLGK